MEAQLTAAQAGELDHQMSRRGVAKEDWQHLLTNPKLCDSVAKTIKEEDDKGKVGKKTTGKVSEEDIERIRKVVENLNPGFHPNPLVEFKGRFLFKRHCGARTAKVTVTDLYPPIPGAMVKRKVHHVEVYEVCVKCPQWWLEDCGTD